VHSDLATEPHQTNAIYGLQNYLMNDPAYMRLYSIAGGIESLVTELANQIDARILLNQPVARIERVSPTQLRIVSRRRNQFVSSNFDFVVVALPNNWLPAIQWGGEALSRAMQKHHAHYDYPAHYLRVSMLFERPFWRDAIAGSYFMHDAFGGCCLYDESLRNPNSQRGALGWLLGGDAALNYSNYADADLLQVVLSHLPACFQGARELFLEGRVHRWVGAVNGLPGGRPMHEPDSRHVPEPVEHADLFVVGDYLFDSTLNGVLDSADVVAEWLDEEMEEEPDPVLETQGVLDV
jgi:monoamine oxidase